MVEVFETERLIGRRTAAGDFDDIYRMHTDPAVMASLGGRLWSEAETHAFLQRVVDHWEQHGFGLWTIRDKATSSFVGRAGLRRLPVDGVYENELLYGYLAERWGRGIATEVACALTAIAFDRLSFADLISFTQPTNAPSRRVMEKSGFLYERDFIYAGLPHVLYRRRHRTIC